MKHLLFVIVMLLGICPAAVGQTVVGFKGINLGMTREQVNQVVRNSEWKYIWGENRDGEHPDTSRDFTVTLTGETSTFKEFSCITRPEGSNCAAFTTIDVNYFEEKVMAIYVKTHHHTPEYAATIRDYVESAMAGLKKKFGKPTNVRKLIDMIDERTLRALDDKIYYVAEWSRTQGKGNAKKILTIVRLYIYKLTDAGEIETVISMYDMPALTKSQTAETVDAKF